MPIVLQMTDVSRTFSSAASELTILENVNFTLGSGEAVALQGPSGCGKTTLLHMAGTLDQPTTGIVKMLNENPSVMSPNKLAAFRNQHIGFIFQEHQLLPQCSVIENILLPTLAGFSTNRKELVQRAEGLLEQVGLKDRRTHRPAALSGGERQRVSVCRALIHHPSLLLADEPTGNLDPKTGQTVGELLLEMSAKYDAALLCVTHSDELAASFPNVVRVEDRRVDFSTVVS